MDGGFRSRAVAPGLFALRRCRFSFPAKYRAAIEFRRGYTFAGHESLQRWPLRGPLQPARLVIEPLQGLHFLVAPKPRVLHRRLQDANGLVIDLDRDRVGM